MTFGEATALGGYLVTLSACFLVVLDEADPGNPLYIGKRFGEKGYVTLCRVAFVVPLLPVILIVCILHRTIPVASKKSWTWLTEERSHD